MSRKTIITAVVVALATLALLSTVALAGRPGFAMTGGRGTSECRMGDRGMRPSFTTEQKEEMKEIRAGFEDQRVELQNKLKVLHVEMQELTEADSPDFGKIERMIDDVAELRAQIMKLKLKQHRAIREILDDDQRVLFDRGIARMLARGAHGGRGEMNGGMKGCSSMGRGGRMGCGPAKCGPKGHGMMGAGAMGMGREMIMCGPDGEEVEGRIIVKKIVDGDEIIIEVQEEE